MTATAFRVLTQLRRDPRTIMLIVGVPCLLEFLLKEIFSGRAEVFQHVGAPLLGLFPFVSMFVVTSVTMLRERTSGTLERLMSMPIAKVDLLFGYALAFAAAAIVQAATVSLLAFGPLGLHVAGPRLAVVALAVGNATLGMALGLLVSAFAQTEFQAVQFMPLLVIPQILLCGLFVARDQMAGWLRAVSDALPLSYAVQALQGVGAHAEPTGRMWRDVVVVAGAVVVALVLAAATLRRRTG
jgi:ABC-2 type transport system permease protein